MRHAVAALPFPGCRFETTDTSSLLHTEAQAITASVLSNGLLRIMGAEQSVPGQPVAENTTDEAQQHASSSVAAQQAQLPSVRPKALVVVGPSGVGKGTLIAKVMNAPLNGGKMGFSCSHTTRAPRTGEQVGLNNIICLLTGVQASMVLW
jgi:signal recognition particle GTPase